MRMITIPEAEYEALVAAKEDLEDILAYDKAVEEGGEGIPHAFMVRLIEGDSPVAVYREHRGLTQAALSEASGVNRVQIAEIEAGRKTGSVKTLKKLADALGVTIDDLV